jgi:hypothetical protein
MSIGDLKSAGKCSYGPPASNENAWIDVACSQHGCEIIPGIISDHGKIVDIDPDLDRLQPISNNQAREYRLVEEVIYGQVQMAEFG